MGKEEPGGEGVGWCLLAAGLESAQKLVGDNPVAIHLQRQGQSVSCGGRGAVLPNGLGGTASSQKG